MSFFLSWISALHEALWNWVRVKRNCLPIFCDRYDHSTTFRGFISLWMSPGFFDLNTRVSSSVKLGRRRSWISCLFSSVIDMHLWYFSLYVLPRPPYSSMEQFMNLLPSNFWHSCSSFGSPCNLDCLFCVRQQQLLEYSFLCFWINSSDNPKV